MRQSRSSKRLLAGAAAALFVLLGSCSTGSSSSADEQSESVLVFAAASLTEVFSELAQSFEAANPSFELTINLAGSSALREQILQGAPADVFASANEANMAQLVDVGEVTNEPSVFARNSLVIAVPTGNPGSVEGLESLADSQLLIGLCAESVPCGALSRDVLDAAGITPSVDTRETDVRSLLTKLIADELDAGLVYRTDIAATDGLVEPIEFDQSDEIANLYLISTLAHAPNPDGASAFVEFVLSPDGQSILARYGFDVDG